VGRLKKLSKPFWAKRPNESELRIDGTTISMIYMFMRKTDPDWQGFKFTTAKGAWSMKRN